MVGVVGSNPIVSTKFDQPRSVRLQTNDGATRSRRQYEKYGEATQQSQHRFEVELRDAEECRELAPRQEFFPAEADSFAVTRSRVTVEKKAASAAFFVFPLQQCGRGCRRRVRAVHKQRESRKFSVRSDRPHPNPLPPCERGSNFES
jgi:hypothetical protein